MDGDSNNDLSFFRLNAVGKMKFFFSFDKFHDCNYDVEKSCFSALGVLVRKMDTFIYVPGN